MNGAELARRLAEQAARHAEWRDTRTVNLNAATNSLSPAARAALGSALSDKGISSGLRSRHHHGGRYLDAIEELVVGAVSRMFDGEDADLRPPTGSLANAAVLAAYARRDAPVMTGSAATLGHFSLRGSGWGRLAGSVLPVPFLPDGIDIDPERLRASVEEQRPTAIVVGSQVMMFPIDLGPVREAADLVGAVVVYDAAHPLGLIAAGEFQRPLLEGADLLTASTQKSLPGPVGGIIVSRDRANMVPIYDTLNQLMSNYQNNRVLALGVIVAEMETFGAEYARATIRNAGVLAEAFAAEGLTPLFAERGYTRSNLFVVPWGSHEETEAFGLRCEAADLIVSTTRLPGAEDGPARFGLRIGVQDVTRHGMGPAEMTELASLVAALAHDPAQGARVGARMRELAQEFRTVRYCFAPEAEGLSGGAPTIGA